MSVLLTQTWPSSYQDLPIILTEPLPLCSWRVKRKPTLYTLRELLLYL